jgi:hypothetical protein
LLGSDRKSVDILATKAFQGGNQVGADSLGHEPGMQVGGGIRSPGAAIRPHGNPGHGFDAAGDHQVFPAGPHFHGRQVDGFQTRGAETVQGDTSNHFIPVGRQSGGFGNVCTLVTNSRDATQDDVVHL